MSDTQHKGPSAPLTVNALAQALADIRPSIYQMDDPTFAMWLACCDAIASTLPHDFAKNFTDLCQHLKARP